jgi:hypothetical protein
MKCRKTEESENNETKKKDNRNKSEDNPTMSKPQSKYKKCTHCGRDNHATKDCWFSPENKGNKSKTGKKSLSTDKTVMMTEEQFNMILERFPKNPKSGKRKERAFSPAESDIESVHMSSPKTKDNSDEDSIYLGLSASQNFHL